MAFLGLSALYARHLDWNAIRLAPACALAHGRTIYPPAGSGIITGHIYPTLAAAAYLPVAWCRQLTLMTGGATLLATLYFSLPFALLARRAGRRWGVRPADATAVFLAALLLSTCDPVLRYVVVLVHADAPGMGLVGLAWLAAAGAEGGAAAWAWAGLFAISAIFAKQTFLPAWLVLAGAAGWSGGRRAVAGFLGGSALTAAAFGLGLLAWGDARAFIYNCWTVPSRHPAATAAFDFHFGMAAQGQDLVSRLRAVAFGALGFFTGWWPGIVLAGWCACLPRRHRDGGLGAARLAGWIALAQLPLALLANAKVGSGANNLAPPLYFALLAAAAGGLYALGPALSRYLGQIRTLLICLLAVLAACNLPRLVFLAGAVATRPDPSAAMVNFARTHPGEVYLPWNPLITWVAEGRFDHFEYGVFDRALAQLPITPAHFHQGLPPRLRWVAVRDGQAPAGHDMFKHYLPHLQDVPTPPGMAGWHFYLAP